MRLPAPGELFVGKYQIRDVLGQGGFARVYRATDTSVGRDVALKVLTPGEDAYSSSIAARFMVEARVIASLRDPHTIRLFEFGESDDGLLYMAFQYVAGVDLGTLLEQRGAMPPEVAVHIARQILQALAEAHAAGVMHRDVKPANILVHQYMGDDFSAKLLDFGIAKADPRQGGAALTRTGAVLGTPRYMAPEQLFGEPVGPYTDLYSLGLVIYQMLVGHPAMGGDQREVLQRLASNEPLHLPPHAARPALRQVVDRMIDREVRRRFASATDVLAALDAAMREDAQLGSQPLSPPPPSQPLPAQPRSAEVTAPTGATAAARRREGNRVLLASLVLCAIVGGAAYWLTAQNQATRADPAVPGALLRPAAETPTPSASERPSAPDRAVATVDDVGAPGDAGAPSDGCATSAGAGRVHRLDIGVRGRSAAVILPAGYSADARYPILLGYGPKYSSANDFVAEAGLDVLTDRVGAILVTPIPRDIVDPWKDVAEEAEVARGTVRAVGERFCVDPSRVYALGHYDGAEIIRRLMCEIPFSAVALAGFGERVTKTFCEPPPTPTMWIIGREDPMIPLNGERGCTKGVHPTADAYDRSWRERNGCESEPREWLAEGKASCTTWQCDTPYVSCRGAGGHHLRARKDMIVLYPFCGGGVLDFPIADAAWRFFEAQGRSIEPFVPAP